LDLREGRVEPLVSKEWASTTRWLRRHLEVSLLDNLDFGILTSGENGGIQ